MLDFGLEWFVSPLFTSSGENVTLSSRNQFFVPGPHSLPGSMRFTTPARTKVRFIVSNNPKIKPHFTVTYKKSDCSFSLIDGSPLKTKLPPKFQHILGFVAQMWIERREQIIKVCQEKMGLKYVNNNQDEDDNLICDGWDIVPEHVLYRRPRPWLEKDQSTR